MVQLIPVLTAIANTAVGTFKNAINGTSQIAFQFLVIGADVAPKISIYGSNDNVNWDIYEISAGVTTKTLTTSGSTSVVRDTFPHEFLSISIDKNGGTTGTISCKLNIKESAV